MDHDHQELPSDPALRVMALESLLVEKGLVDPAALDALIDAYEHKVGPRNGARVVARAWVDLRVQETASRRCDRRDRRTRLRGRPRGAPGGRREHARLPQPCRLHLCSCYPWPVLGLPPVWYKSAPYRSRAVIDPRGVLCEFGLDLAEDVEVRVWDSTSEMRYLVLPERPAGTEHMGEEELATLVTRDAMIGTAKVTPAGGAT